VSTLGFEDLVCRALDGDPGLALTAPHAITVRAGTVLLAGPPELLVRGSCDGSWLLLDGSPALALSAPAALVRGSELGGAAKLVVTSAGTITTRAELPLTDVSTLAARLDDTLVGMAAARRDAPCLVQTVGAPLDPPLAIPPRGVAPDVAELCGAAGWPGSVRADGTVTVGLGTRDGFARALIAYQPARDAVRVSTELDVVSHRLADACEEALALFLLRAAAAVRLVRPVTGSRRGERVIGFEAVYQAPVVASEIGHALAALEVATGMTSREVTVLARDAAMARAYLALDGDSHAVGPCGSTPTAGRVPAEGATR